ncbi:hypothetical protein EV649_7834 [Kribbella sp. VKM Ac-2569]|nr:hypothetical protein EV649_7834 [Kribbella sp. VKM Ac-2569]
MQALTASTGRLDTALKLYRTKFRHHHGVAIRTGFLRLDDGRDFPRDPDPARSPFRASEHQHVLRDAVREDVGSRPPLTVLSRRGELALRLHLTALYVASKDTKPGRRFNSQIKNADGTDSWANLAAVDGQYDQRRRLIVRAVQRLSAVQLAEPRSADPGRWDRWRLIDETQRGTPYLVPHPSEPVLVVPSLFFLNGWHLVLRPREIVTLLMLADLARRHPSDHAETGVGAPNTTRRRYYGVTPEVYEAHNELEEFGFLELQGGSVHAARRAGRVEAGVADDHREGRAQMEALRFNVVWDAAREDASRTVRKALLSHPVPPRFDEWSTKREPRAKEPVGRHAETDGESV